LGGCEHHSPIGAAIGDCKLQNEKPKWVVRRADFDRLFPVLTNRGYEIIGPTIRESAIVYDKLSSVSQLPAGWSDEQEAGTYQLRRRGDQALFGYAVGPQSWKKLLHPPVLRLWSANRSQQGFHAETEEEPSPRFAFVGVRACELRAMGIQDRVFQQGAHTDKTYRARRSQAFIIAVNCGQAGGSCFCVSMNAGPKADSGFDLALTEILEGGRHDFVVEIGSELGAEVLRQLPCREATGEDIARADRIMAETSQSMGREMDTRGIKELFYNSLEHPRWDEVASRCLTCANCTMVCPTCFCTTVEDSTDLSGDHAQRWRKWDSCFTMDFSYIHGGSVRATARSRYRQWMTHKLATWIDQFGTSGCVGCGRCITWCPVGIDITEEVRAIRVGKTEGAN